MNLILFGMKGSGKSYWGRKVAEKAGWPFLDTDALLSPFKPVRELYLEIGDRAFRKKEEEVVAKLSGIKRHVVALGGGTLLSAVNRRGLPDAILIYLKIGIERISWATPEPKELYYAKREPIFSSIPAVVIDLEKMTDEQVFSELLCQATALDRSLPSPHLGNRTDAGLAPSSTGAQRVF